MVKTQFSKCSGKLPRQCLGGHYPRIAKFNSSVRAMQNAATALYNFLVDNGVAGVTDAQAATAVLEKTKGVQHHQIVTWLRTLAQKAVICARRLPKCKLKPSERRVYILNQVQVDSFQKWRYFVTVILGIPMMSEIQPAV